MKKIIAVILALFLSISIPGVASNSPPSPNPLDPDLGAGDNATNVTPVPGGIIPPRASMSSYGHDKSIWGDLTENSTTTGVWVKNIGKDGEIELRWDNNGTVYKITINLVNFKGSTTTSKPPNGTLKIPSELSILGYLGTIPVTVKWEAYPLRMKESVIWDTDALTNVIYIIKIDQPDLKISDTLDFLKDGNAAGLGLAPPTMMDGNNESMELNWSLDQIKADQWNLNINWTYPIGSQAPYVLDPTISFNGTTFTIDDAQWEIKTYQQVWSILGGNGCNPRYLGGYTAADSDGTGYHVDINKVLDAPLDLSSMTDFSFNLKTTNADASWNLRVYINSAGGWSAANRIMYTKSLTNDVDATYTLSDFSVSTVGTVDDSAIDYIVIACEGIDTGEAADVIIQVKDLKFTTPVKTSDLYNDTGRFVLASEDFEGDDGLALDSYDAGWTVTKAGTSISEIDDAQNPDSGSTSLTIYRDGTNSVNSYRTLPDMYDYTRIRYVVRPAQTNAKLQGYIREGATVVGVATFYDDAGLDIYYGDGIGGSNSVTVPYSADTNYEIWMDIDPTNDKYRIWIDGVMYPGPNANSAGFDNLFNDLTVTKCDRFDWYSNGGTGTFWVDGIRVYAGFEDFSALSTPHDPDDITEAVSPTNTDYGRQTWDGDWTQYGNMQVSVDNTDVVIGTNSIKGLDSGVTLHHGFSYTFDSSADIINATHIRFYCKIDDLTNVDRLQIELRCPTMGDGLYIRTGSLWSDMVNDKWKYFDLAFPAGWIVNGVPDYADLTSIMIYFRTTNTEIREMHIDGFHFYGDNASGTCWEENRLDLSNEDFIQEGPMYDFGGFVDTGAGTTHTYNATMSNATDNLNIEFADFNRISYFDVDGSDCHGVFSLDGFDEDNHIVWSPIGGEGVTPSNKPIGYSLGIEVDFHNVTLDYVDSCALGTNDRPLTMYDVYIHASDFSYVLHNYPGISDFTCENVILENYIAGSGLSVDGNYVYNDITIICSGDNVRVDDTYRATLINSTFDKTKIALVDSGWLVSKNHNDGSDYIISVGDTAKAYGDIPDVGKWGIGADVEILSGTFNIDETVTLTSGSWTKDATATVKIYNETNLTMLASSFTPSDFTINETGNLLEKNFTTPALTTPDMTVHVTPTNTTYSSWTPTYNIYNGSGWHDTYWSYDWGGNVSNTTNQNRSYHYLSGGLKTIRIGNVDYLGTWINTTTTANMGAYDPGGGGGGTIVQVSFTYKDTIWGIKFEPIYPTRLEIDSILWTFGDGSSSVRASPTHWYPDQGEYVVDLTISFEGVGGSYKSLRIINIGERSDIQILVHAIEKDDDRVYLSLGYRELVFSELALFVSGSFALIAAAVSIKEKEKYKKRERESGISVTIRVLAIVWAMIALGLVAWIEMGG